MTEITGIKQANSQQSESKQLRNEIANTPFVVIEDEKGFFITMANYKLPQLYQTLEEAEQRIRAIDWELIGLYTYLVAQTSAHELTTNKNEL